MERGKFIVFEGIDGSGKSTQSALLAEALKEAGRNVYSTCEPSKRPVGKLLRDVLTRKLQADEQTIAALFLADRLDHIRNPEDGMLMQLEAGTHVVCDRYYFSSYAYHPPHVSQDWVIEANQICADQLRPDIVFFVDVPPDESLRRIAAGREETDLFENKERLTQTRNNYLQAIERLKDQENVMILDGTKTVDDIAAQIWTAVQNLTA